MAAGVLVGGAQPSRVRTPCSGPQPHRRGVFEVSDVLTDALDAETGRSLDAYSYILQKCDDETEIPVAFRHPDLVSLADS